MLSRVVGWDSSSYQFRAKTGNIGAQWGYTVQANGTATTLDTNIWQLVLKDLNGYATVRTAALDDVDGLEQNIVDDLMLEWSQAEGLSMIKNNDQAGTGTTVTTGGADGVRGLDQYGGANATYTGGTYTSAAFGSTGTSSTSGLHSVATYDQITSNAAGVANKITYADIINVIHALPQQYWSNNNEFMINPQMLAAIRGLVDNNGTPIFERMSPLVYEGRVGMLLGYNVVVNAYVDSPISSTTTAGTNSLYPLWFGEWDQFHTIVDRLSLIIRRFDQTVPGSIVFYGEKRVATSIRDPFAGIRLRSTATAT